MFEIDSQMPFEGTEIKINVNIAPIGEVTMDDYDFIVEVYAVPGKVVRVEKKDARKIDSNNYLIKVDTAQTGAGRLRCKITAYIPDVDFEDSLRTEILCMDTGITVMKVDV